MFLAEFIEIVVLSAIVTAVFLGGWHPLVVPTEWLRQTLTPLLVRGDLRRRPSSRR